jgi:hypothetical protein
MWDAFSDERTGLSFAIASGPRKRGNSLVSDSRLPQSGGLGSSIYIAQEQGGPVIPPGTGFRFRRLIRLARDTVEVFEPASTHVLLANLPRRLSLYILGMDRIGNTASNSSSIIACVSVAAGTCLPSCRLATAIFCCSTIQGFQLLCHNILFSINANSHAFKMRTRALSVNDV